MTSFFDGMDEGKGEKGAAFFTAATEAKSRSFCPDDSATSTDFRSPARPRENSTVRDPALGVAEERRGSCQCSPIFRRILLKFVVL